VTNSLDGNGWAWSRLLTAIEELNFFERITAITRGDDRAEACAMDAENCYANLPSINAVIGSANYDLSHFGNRVADV
jgi:hypothetical protein